MNPSRFILGTILRFLLKGIVQHDCMGFKLCDINTNPNDDASFVSKTAEALALIRESDPRRFSRIQRSIQYFVNKEHYGGGAYYPGNVCIIDFGRYEFGSNQSSTPYYYAAMIVHEATHGAIRAKRIRRTKRNWIQMERICRAEENRFLARLEPVFGKSLQLPFDPEEWIRMKPSAYRSNALRNRRREEQQKAQHPEGDATSQITPSACP